MGIGELLTVFVVFVVIGACLARMNQARRHLGG
jgi:hypothetical protein